DSDHQLPRRVLAAADQGIGAAGREAEHHRPPHPEAGRGGGGGPQSGRSLGSFGLRRPHRRHRRGSGSDHEAVPRPAQGPAQGGAALGQHPRGPQSLPGPGLRLRHHHRPPRHPDQGRENGRDGPDRAFARHGQGLRQGRGGGRLQALIRRRITSAFTSAAASRSVEGLPHFIMPFRIRRLLLPSLLLAAALPAPAADLDGSPTAVGNAEAQRLYADANAVVTNVTEGPYSYAYIQFYWKRAESYLERAQ